jgi:hypothetical protein
MLQYPNQQISQRTSSQQTDERRDDVEAPSEYLAPWSIIVASIAISLFVFVSVLLEIWKRRDDVEAPDEYLSIIRICVAIGLIVGCSYFIAPLVISLPISDRYRSNTGERRDDVRVPSKYVAPWSIIVVSLLCVIATSLSALDCLLN